MSFECLDCKAIDGGYCSDCATPNDELRELAEQWRAFAEDISRDTELEEQQYLTLTECADELEGRVRD